MKSLLTALTLLAATATAVALYPTDNIASTVPTQPGRMPDNPPVAEQRPVVEVVFVLDTTGSMGGLIQAAKEKIWSIATSMASAQPAPQIKMGLVAYRDRGDDYVTRLVDLSSDLDSVYATLMDFKADGGGDGPESVNQALYDAVHSLSWSESPQAYKVVFLVGDAPPHMDYPNDVPYTATLRAASQKGIVVNTIQCGQDGRTTHQWQQIAKLADGRYFQVDQAGSAVAVNTPYDEQLATLSAELDDTRLYYGNVEEQAEKQQKLDATDKFHALSSVASRARRAVFNTSKSGDENFIGEGELVDDVANGRVELDAMEQEKLAAAMQAMEPQAQQALIESTATRRQELRAQITELSQQRADYLEKKIEQRGGAEASIDQKIYSTVREQAGRHGLLYDEAAPAY